MTIEQEQEIIRLYTEEKLSGDKIGSMFKCSSETIYRLLKRNNISRRTHRDAHFKYAVNTNYFKSIDSPNKAYILGLLYADGCNIETGFRLSLNQRDEAILERVKNEIEYTGILYDVKRHGRVEDKCKLLLITSSEISKDLNRLGCIPRKSLVLKFPTEEQVPSKYLSHFIRGYFDGDGSINRSGYYQASMVGTFEFLTSVYEVLQKELNISLSKLAYMGRNRGSNTYQLRIAGNIRLFNFLNWLYKNSEIHLERKHNKYQEFLNHYTPTVNKRKNNPKYDSVYISR